MKTKKDSISQSICEVFQH